MKHNLHHKSKSSEIRIHKQYIHTENRRISFQTANRESLNLNQKWQGITKSAGKNSVSLATLMFLNFKVIFSWSFLGGGVIVAAIIMEVTSLFQSDESKNH